MTGKDEQNQRYTEALEKEVIFLRDLVRTLAESLQKLAPLVETHPGINITEIVQE